MNDYAKMNCAVSMQDSIEEEAHTIMKYTEIIKSIKDSAYFSESDKTILVSSLEEIVSDELNHQLKLQDLYILLTNIQPNADWGDIMIYNIEKKQIRTDVTCLSCKYFNIEEKKCINGIGKVCFEYDEKTGIIIDPITKLPIKA